MNIQTKRYLWQLRSQLSCPIWVRRRLLASFLPTMELYLQENPKPSRAELLDNFGPPAQMARVMLEHVYKSERQQYHKNRLILRCAMSAIAVMLVTCCIYVMFFMEWRDTVIHLEHGNGAAVTQTEGVVPNE